MEKRASLATMNMSHVPVRYSQFLADGLSYQGTLWKVKIAFLSLYLNENTIRHIFRSQQEAANFIHYIIHCFLLEN